MNAYAYDDFGQGATNRVEMVANPFRYVGRYGVMTDGDDLLSMRARYYIPSLGRFTQSDPIGFAGGDLNLYAYVGNNPITRLDPLGLWYVDVNITGGRRGRGGTAGVQIGPAGVFGYVGAGVGNGGGVSVSLNSGDPSSGWAMSGVISGGTRGLGGQITISYGVEGVSASVGGGWGFGLGWSVGAVHTWQVWGQRRDSCQ